MIGLIMRIKMHFCLRRLEKLWYENDGFIVGEAALEFSSTKSKLKVLKALESVKCAAFVSADNSSRPIAIREGDRSAIYAVERSELWLNRIAAFFAGILTSVAAHFIIQFLQAVPF